MIYWLMLTFAVISNAAKGYCSKRLSGTADGMFENIMINLIFCDDPDVWEGETSMNYVYNTAKEFNKRLMESMAGAVEL